MISSLSERLGQKGYTIVARAPEMAVPQLSDGSWHVVGGSNPTQPDTMHEIEPELIPFILSRGGDIVLYRLSEDGIGLAKPVLSRGGMAGRPPHLSTVHSFDPELVQRIAELQASVAKPVAAPAPPKAKPRVDWRVPAGVAAGLILLLGGAGYLAMPTPAPSGFNRWVPDMNNPRDVARMQGATTMAIPNQHDPEKVDLYRVYASGSGKGGRDLIGTVRKRDFDEWKGELPDAYLPWRRNF